MAKPGVTRHELCDALAKQMREFGYPDVSEGMAGEILDAYIKQKDDDDVEIPHGIIGMFMKDHLREFEEGLVDKSFTLSDIANNKEA